MILSIIGIVLGLSVMILFFWLKKDQEMTTDLLDGDIKGNENALMALQEEFTQYQVDNERKIIELEKTLEIKSKSINRIISKIKADLPIEIRKVVGHIEFARPLDKNKCNYKINMIEMIDG